MADKDAKEPTVAATEPPSALGTVTSRLACPLCGKRGSGNVVAKARRVTITCKVDGFVYATNKENLEAIGAAVAAMG